MKTIETILVPTDFSEFSLASMEHALSLAALYGARIYLLHVVDGEPVMTFHTVDLHSETVFRDRRAKAEEMLQQLVEGQLRNVKDLTPVVRRGDPAKEIVRFALEEGVGLIVMATHGRTGLAHVVLGSVAEKVVRRSSVPVLTVKPAEVAEVLLNQDDIEEQLHLKL